MISGAQLIPFGGHLQGAGRPEWIVLSVKSPECVQGSTESFRFLPASATFYPKEQIFFMNRSCALF